MIAILYIGQRRHQDVTADNHKKVIAAIQSVAPVKVYDFMQPEFDRTQCPFPVGKQCRKVREFNIAGLQLWDFLTANEMVDESIVIKMRTDVWYPASFIKMLPEHIQRIVDGKAEIDFLGLGCGPGHLKSQNETILNHELKERHSCVLRRRRMTIHPGIVLVPDLFIVANKSGLIPRDEAIQKYQQMPLMWSLATGHIAFTYAIKPNANYIVTCCQAYIVRYHIDNPTDKLAAISHIEHFTNRKKRPKKIPQEELEWYTGDHDR